jgi:hypothetical protein
MPSLRQETPPGVLVSALVWVAICGWGASGNAGWVLESSTCPAHTGTARESSTVKSSVKILLIRTSRNFFSPQSRPSDRIVIYTRVTGALAHYKSLTRII